ncbi:MAG TPA: GtrA family protein [Myxococcaceae bacterium]|nr:GtrA family protein [Myxococcaceae bacterium]
MRPRGGGGSLRSWAVPSLMVGAVATLVDVGVLLGAMRWLHASSAEGAMLGVAVGSTVAFLGNRRFAFRSSATALLPEALRFLAGTMAGMLVHAALVRTLADRLGVPVVLAKLVSDVCVFTFGQLLLLRFFVFPARRKLEALGRSRAPRWDVPEPGLDAPVARVG